MGVTNITEIEKVKGYLEPIGEKTSQIFGSITNWVGKTLPNLTELQIKIVALIILGLALFLVIKVITITNKVVKFGLIILFTILIISIITTF